jgi:transposase-like protein
MHAGMVETGRHWTESEAREVIAELRSSGETPAEFARRKGITRQRLGYWMKRVAPLGSRQSPGEAGARETRFVAVALPPSVRAPSPGWIEVAVGGTVVRVREALDVDHVARLVEAIARRAGGPC